MTTDVRADDPPLPTGRQVRRWTRRHGRIHSDASVADLMGDLYTAALAVAVASSMVFSATSTVADDGTGRGSGGPGSGLDPEWLVILPVVAITAVLVGVATRLGPVALSAAQSTWWLPLPADRRTLVRSTAYRWPLVGALLGAIGGIAIALSTGAGALVSTTLLVTAMTVAVVTVAGLAQHSQTTHRALRLAADGVVVLTPIVAFPLALTGQEPPTFASLGIWVTSVTVVATIVLLLAWDARLGEIPETLLRRQGLAAEEAMVAVLSVDPRALSRALAARSEPDRRRSARVSGLGRVPPRWRTWVTLIRSDVFLVTRTPRHLTQVALSTTLPALALLSADPDPVTVAVAVLLGAWIAASGVTEGVRRAQANPALDALLPLGQLQVRAARLVLPTLILLAWSGLVFGLVSWRYGEPTGWLLLGLGSAPIWAAAGLRTAYRPLPDFSGPVIETPSGPIPLNVIIVVSQGPDVAFLGGVLVFAAVVQGAVPTPLLAVELLFSVVAVAVAVYPPKRRP